MAPPRQTAAGTGPPSPPEALLAAGAALLAERPPSAISGRELAESAGVNYGLVHRHFGSKSVLLARAFDRTLGEFERAGLELDGLPVPLRLAESPGTWRSLVHVALDPAGFGDLRPSTPILDRVALGVAAQRPELDSDQVRAVVGLAFAIEVGVPLHRPVLARALGLHPDEPAIDRLIAEWLDGLYHGQGSLGAAPIAGEVAPAPPSRPAAAADDSVDTRLVVAGADLLVERAPSAISGRQLATAAGVNYGLIHHYFGSKDEVLRRSVQMHHDRFFAAHGGDDQSPDFFSVCEHPGYVRAMTWGALDPSMAEAPQRFPVTESMLTRLVRPDLPADVGLTTHVAIFMVVSLQMAWALLLPVTQQAFEIDPRRLEPLLVPVLRDLLVDPMSETGSPRGTLST